MSSKTKKVFYSIVFGLPLAMFFILAFSGAIRAADPSGLSNIGGFVNSFFVGPVCLAIGMLIRKSMNKAVLLGKVSVAFRDVIVIGFMLIISIVLTLLISNQITGDTLLGPL